VRHIRPFAPVRTDVPRHAGRLVVLTLLLLTASPLGVSADPRAAHQAHDDARIDEPGYAHAEKHRTNDCFGHPTDFRSTYQVDLRLPVDDLRELSASSPDGVVTHLYVALEHWQTHLATPSSPAMAHTDRPSRPVNGVPVRLGFEPYDPARAVERFPVFLDGVTVDGKTVSFGRPGDATRLDVFRMPAEYLTTDRLGLFPCVEPSAASGVGLLGWRTGSAMMVALTALVGVTVTRRRLRGAR